MSRNLILGRRRWWWGVCFLGAGVILTVHSILKAHRDFFEPPPPNFNYFEEAEAYAEKGGYLISSPVCKILNVSEWALLPLLPPKEESLQCPTQRKWTYVDVQSQEIVLNSSAVRDEGYSPGDLSCCYKTIRRAENKIDPDDFIEMSKDCVPFGEALERRSAKVDEGFVRVLCTSISWPYSGDVVYRAFHSFPIKPRSKRIIKGSKGKGHRWMKKGSKKVPSVVLLGIDSVSRLSFHRTMSRTKKALQDLGAVELQGYTKVGENTFPNAVAMTTGMDNLDFCGGSNGPYDKCPFIWKSYESSGWATAFVEDVPGLAIFNYLKKGFVKPPTTHYLRPFMLALYESTPRKSYYMLDCAGGEPPESIMAQYTKDIMSVSSNPAFIYSWTTNVAHLSPWGPAGSPDLTYSSLIESLNSSIVIFLSDHGYRYGPLRQSFPGWYEDKLPLLWIYLPLQVRKEFPSWQKSLEINSLRLSSPFDIHATLLHILKSYTSPSSEVPEKSSSSGVSLLNELKSSRSCKDARIPPHLCACVVPKNLPLNDTRLFAAATKAVEWINDKTDGNGCIPQKLTNLRAGAILEDNGKNELVVGFVSDPGEFIFEATVEVDKELQKYSLVGEVLRMNKISTDVSCVREATLEKLCYCKDTNANPVVRVN